MSRHPTLFALLAGAMTILAGGFVVPAGPAGAAPPAGPAIPAGRGLALAALADRVDALGAGDPAFATTTLDQERNVVVVHRVGGAAGLRQSYSVRSTGSATIEYKDALLSAKQSTELMDSVVAQSKQLEAEGIKVTAVEQIGTGPISIKVAELVPATRSLASRFAKFGSGTVRVEQADKVSLFTRQDDGNSSWSGGGRIALSGHGECTTNFGGPNSAGVRYMMTAYHCVNPEDPRVWDGGDDFMGRATLFDPGHDTVAIPVATVARIWDGPWNTPNFTKRVTAVERPRLDNRICTSGSFSGVRCYGTIVGGSRILRTHPATGQAYWSYILVADAPYGFSLAGPGDSGGPVFTPHGDVVSAVGMISGGVITAGWQAPCVGDPSRPANAGCSRRLYFTDTHYQATQHWGLDLTR